MKNAEAAASVATATCESAVRTAPIFSRFTTGSSGRIGNSMHCRNAPSASSSPRKHAAHVLIIGATTPNFFASFSAAGAVATPSATPLSD